nr:4-alpha-glucanotransferase [Brachybacterium sp. Marseille-Q7125]
MVISASAVQGQYVDRHGEKIKVPTSVQRAVAQLLDDAYGDPLSLELDQETGGRPLARRRRWGVHLQLAPLVDDSTWGSGDYGSLRRLGLRAAADGADFVAIGPTNWEAVGFGGQIDPSPYSPVSRFLHSLRYVEVPAVIGWDSLQIADREELSRRGAQLNISSRNGRADLSVVKLKAEALRRIFVQHKPLRSETNVDSLETLLASALLRYLRRMGAEQIYLGSLDEPQKLEFMVWSQRILRSQLAAIDRVLRAAGMDIGVVGDLQVGSSRDGIDHEVFAGCYCRDLSIGTPPDDYVPDGQDWQLAFPVPHSDRRRACAQTLALAYGVAPVGGLRIDHVLGMQRLWARLPGGAGTYVNYDIENQMRAVREVVERGKLIVGEDLGNVPPGFRESLKENGVLGTDVVWWARGSDGSLRTGLTTEGREESMLLTAFHDTSSTARFITGDDLRLLDRKGRLGKDLKRAEEQRLVDLAELGVGPTSSIAEAIYSIYAFAFSSRPDLVSIYYPDFLGLACTENVPGTGPEEYPNWVLTYGDPMLSIEEQLGGQLAQRLLSLER